MCPKLRNNWFERNPKKTLLFLLLSCVLGISFLAEKIIIYRNQTYISGIIRYIRLKELSPLTSRFYSPTTEELKASDNLPAKNILYRTDENGFMIPSKIYDTPDVTIVFLGGSSTECRSVDEKYRFPYLTGQLLIKETGLRINSYNSGVSGNNTLHLIDILLNKIIPLNPNIVVLMENINDLGTILHEGTYWNNNPFRSPIVKAGDSHLTFLQRTKEFLFPNLYHAISRLFQFSVPVRDEFSHTQGRELVINSSFFLEEFRKNLQLFIYICRVREITPILMTQQNRMKKYPDSVIKNSFLSLERQGISYQKFKIIYDLFNETIRDVCLKNNILCIDLAQRLPQEKEFMYDIVHLTENGSKLVSQIIKRDILSLVTATKPIKKTSHLIQPATASER